MFLLIMALLIFWTEHICILDFFDVVFRQKQSVKAPATFSRDAAAKEEISDLDLNLSQSPWL